MNYLWFSNEDLMHGGTLHLVLGPKPNKDLWKEADVKILFDIKISDRIQ